MVVKISQDVAQYHMAEMIHGIDCEYYMDHVGIWSDGSFEDHLQIVDKVLARFSEFDMKCIPLKCGWGVKETDFLGFWMTPQGIKPRRKRNEAILQMDRPRSNTDIISFIGSVNYYKYLWPRRAHVLAPLAQLTGRGKFKWDERHQISFDEMKSITCADAINMYPDYNQPFHIYTDASDFQLGATLIQNGRPLAYFSEKLTSAQKN